MKGEAPDPQSSWSQGTPRSCKTAEERPGCLEEKYIPKADIPTQNMRQQHHVHEDDNLPMEEVPRRRLSSQEPSSRFLLTDDQEEEVGGKEQSDLSGCLYEEGEDSEPDVMEISASPPQGVLLNSRSSELWPTHPLERRTECPVLNSMDPEGPAEVKEGSPDSSGSGILRHGNHVPIQQCGENEAQTGPRESESKINDDFHLICSSSDEGEGPGSSSQISTESPDDPEHDLHPSQEEFCRQSNLHASSNEDYYNYIEEFLGDGTLVNIDLARTCVDLQSGTIKTNMEVSAEDDGVTVKHEVEWVTRFLPARKQK